MGTPEEGPAGAYRRRMKRAALLMTAGAVIMGMGIAAAGAAKIMDGNVTEGAAAAAAGMVIATGAPLALGTAGGRGLGQIMKRGRRPEPPALRRSEQLARTEELRRSGGAQARGGTQRARQPRA